MSRRRALGACAAAAWPLLRPAHAQAGPIRFALDSRLDGPSACFVLPLAKGYFKQEKLDVELDSSAGAAGVVARVATGQHELGCADLAALMEYHGNNGAAPAKPVAVMTVHANTPSAVLALRGSGIRSPIDLRGRRVGAPASDAARRTWPVFARLNAIDGVAWSTADANATASMLLRGEVDAITGVAYTALPDIEARGVASEDIVLLPYLRYGVKHYGQAILASDEFMRRRPEALKGFLRAFARGMRDVVADPGAALALVRARDRSIDPARELRRLLLALDMSVLTADARSEGFGSVTGPRLALMASQLSDAFGTRERINPNAVWNGSFLPNVAERNLFAAGRHPT